MAEPKPDKIKELEKQNATLQVQLDQITTGRTRVKTEREEIQSLEYRLNETNRNVRTTIEVIPRHIN